jgi:hypothetical protein
MNAASELILSGIACVPVALALGVTLGARRRIGWPRAFLLGTFGITIPLLVFLLSGFLMPEAKSQCAHGWIDCWQGPKLVILPIVIWTLWALYRVETHGPHPWISTTLTAALAAGMIVCICSVGQALLLKEVRGVLLWFLLIPSAVHAWIAWRWWQMLELDRRATIRASGIGAAATLPFFATSAWWAHTLFAKLPDNPPSCFVVTAASHGHAFLTGPRMPMLHNGRTREATHQVLVFWTLERHWDALAPATHRAFRRIYNRVGPPLARRITRRWQADLVCLVLLPFEVVALATLAGLRLMALLKSRGMELRRE